MIAPRLTMVATLEYLGHAASGVMSDGKRRFSTVDITEEERVAYLPLLGVDNAVRVTVEPAEADAAPALPAATDADIAREFWRRFRPVKVLVGRFKVARGSLAYAEADGDDADTEWLSGVSADGPSVEEHAAGEDGFVAALERARALVKGGV